MRIAMQPLPHVRRTALAFFVLLAGLLGATPFPAQAREKVPRWEALGDYVARVGQSAPPTPVRSSLGSLWKDNGLPKTS